MAIYDMKTKNLCSFGIKNPLRELNKMSEDVIYEEAKDLDVIKFEKIGDSVEGVFIAYEESRQYPSSYALKIATMSGKKVVFVSQIVIDKIISYGITGGVRIKLDYLGKKKTQDGQRVYNDYKLYFAK